MANTVTSLNYANTFGDWVVTTNALVRENNNLASNNYTKSTGTLFLSDPTLGLQVANNALVQGQLQVLGTGSSVRIDNNLTVTQGQIYFSNTTLGLNNAGQMIVGGLLNVNGPGLGMVVLNNSQLNGYLKVSGNTAIANTLSVTGTTTISNNTIISGNTTVGGNVIAQNYVNVTNDVNATNFNALNSFNGYNLSILGNGRLTGSLTYNNGFANNSTVYGTSNVNYILANTINNTGLVYTNALQANSSVNTAVLTVTGNTYTNYLTVNTAISVPTMTLTGSLLSATNATGYFNSLVTTGGLTVNGNFVLTGTTVYATNNFTLSANAASPVTSTFNVYRPSAANATIRWNETSKYWDLNDVNTSNFWRIHTDQFLSDNTQINGTTNIASSNAVYYLQTLANTTNTNISTVYTAISANVSMISGIDATQNTRLNSIETINSNQNTTISIIQGVDNNQNTQIAGIQGVDLAQNASITIIQGVDNNQNTQIAGIQGVDLAQNSAISVIQGVDLSQNSAISIIQGVDLGQNATIIAVNQYAASAYAFANALSGGTATDGVARQLANGANGLAQGAYNTANGANGLAAGAFNAANNRVSSITGTANQVIVTGTLTPTLSLPQSIATTSNFQVGSFGVGTAASTVSGEIRAANNITAYYSSDRQFKENIQDIPNALESVDSIGGKLFDWTDDYIQARGGEDEYFLPKQDFGVIAQDVQAVFPRAVRTRPDGSLAVDYEKLVALAFAAIKELKAEIDDLKGK